MGEIASVVRPRTGGLGGTSALAAMPDHALRASVDRKRTDLGNLRHDLKEAMAEYMAAPAGPEGDKLRKALKGRMRHLFEQIDDLKADLRKSLDELLERIAERQSKDRKAEDARALERKSAFARWLADYDERRYVAKKLEEIQKFLESMDRGRLASLAFLSRVGAIDGVGGFAPTDIKSGAAAEEVEKQVRLIERPRPPRARTDRLHLGKATTGRLDLSFLGSGHVAEAVSGPA
jgi:5'-deoxynucleotidase YfbR-like HD superfamily hydrolase